jgi:uncharacterized membrane protein
LAGVVLWHVAFDIGRYPFYLVVAAENQGLDVRTPNLPLGFLLLLYSLFISESSGALASRTAESTARNLTIS